MDDAKAREDLEFIRGIMEGVRRRNLIDGIYYVIWGVLIPVCTVTTWWMGTAGREGSIFVVWTAGIPLGAVLSMVTGRYRSRRGRQGPRGPESRLYYTAWIAFGTAEAVAMTAGWGFGKLEVGQGLFVLGLLLSMVYAMDAAFGRLRGFYAVAAGWMLAGLASLWLPIELASLTFGLAAIPLTLFPGLFLMRMSAQNRHGSP